MSVGLALYSGYIALIVGIPFYVGWIFYWWWHERDVHFPGLLVMWGFASLTIFVIWFMSLGGGRNDLPD